MAGEEFVEQDDQFVRAQMLRHFGEIANIGEENGDGLQDCAAQLHASVHGSDQVGQLRR